MPRKHAERHYTSRIGWLRAAVLGANDGIISTASLIVGVAAATSTQSSILLAGIAGLFGGAMSMAAGEYVSVSSQADIELADLARERAEIAKDEAGECKELAAIYVSRGLDADLAAQVASQMMAHDALAAHARDELGLTEIHQARPLQAAIYSAITFAIGAALPLILLRLSSDVWTIPTVAAGSLLCLGFLGGLAARTGGANISVGIARVTLLGAAAMAITTAAGTVFGPAA